MIRMNLNLCMCCSVLYNKYIELCRDGYMARLLTVRSRFFSRCSFDTTTMCPSWRIIPFGE